MLGKWIVEQRERRGWSQMELVVRLRAANPNGRITESSISRWELGKVEPQLENFRALCAIFETPARDVLKLLKPASA